MRVRSTRELTSSLVKMCRTCVPIVCGETKSCSATRAFVSPLKHGPAPIEITTDRAPVYPRVIEDAVPGARHVLERYQNNRVETDHGRRKARLPPMRGVKTIRSQRVLASGHGFVQNLRRGHYQHTVGVGAHHRVRSHSPNSPTACRPCSHRDPVTG